MHSCRWVTVADCCSGRLVLGPCSFLSNACANSGQGGLREGGLRAGPQTRSVCGPFRTQRCPCPSPTAQTCLCLVPHMRLMAQGTVMPEVKQRQEEERQAKEAERQRQAELLAAGKGAHFCLTCKSLRGYVCVCLLPSECWCW